MLAQIITENGQKKIIPLTADAGAGNPVGTIIPMYKKSSPSGYLYCDGSTFDETKYPLLYAYLGSNVLPDYREFALVGAEQNTTDVYNASTNPTGTIHDHDVYTEGQAKDDQLQDHTHKIDADNDPAIISKSGATNRQVSNGTGGYIRSGTVGVNSGRYGDVTRGKRKAVFFYIKATSGLSENAQDNVINTLNEERSYSTEEVNTGKKWIDGKPIYRKVIDFGALPNTTNKGVAHNITNLGTIVKLEGIAAQSGGTTRISLPFVAVSAAENQVSIQISNTNVTCTTATNRSSYDKTFIIIEYTKTTD